MIASWLATILLSVPAVNAALEIQLENEPLVQGRETRIAVAGAEAATGPLELTVTYRAGSIVPVTETLTVDTAGETLWVPRLPGLATLELEVGGEVVRRNISVRYASLPMRGVLVFAAAGSVFLGLIVFGFTRVSQ